MFFVYAIFNKLHNKIYIGQTKNIERRLNEHNEKRSNHFTAKYDGDWVLIYQEQFSNRKEAILREKQLKGYQCRQYIKQYIVK